MRRMPSPLDRKANASFTFLAWLCSTVRRPSCLPSARARASPANRSAEQKWSPPGWVLGPRIRAKIAPQKKNGHPPAGPSPKAQAQAVVRLYGALWCRFGSITEKRARRRTGADVKPLRKLKPHFGVFGILKGSLAPPNDPQPVQCGVGVDAESGPRRPHPCASEPKAENSLENVSSFIAPLPWNERAHTE
jgi:hypothetical protein